MQVIVNVKLVRCRERDGQAEKRNLRPRSRSSEGERYSMVGGQQKTEQKNRGKQSRGEDRWAQERPLTQTG